MGKVPGKRAESSGLRGEARGPVAFRGNRSLQRHSGCSDILIERATKLQRKRRVWSHSHAIDRQWETRINNYNGGFQQRKKKVNPCKINQVQLTKDSTSLTAFAMLCACLGVNSELASVT